MIKLKKLKRKISNNGFSLVEIVLASSLFVLISSAFIGAIAYAQQSETLAGSRARANILADEGIEALRSIKEVAWNELIYDQSGLDSSNDIWEFLGEGTTETIDIFTRKTEIFDVCRDASDNISSCPATYNDPNTKKVKVSVSWNYLNTERTVERILFLTNWKSFTWEQTDWSGGDGQNIWSDETRFQSDDGNIDYSAGGEIKLDGTGGTTSCDPYTWDFNDSGNYNYDPSKIEITSSNAQLIEVTGSASGQTLDSGFDSGSPWTSYSWDQEAQETVTNNRISDWGNPSYWVYSYLTLRKNREIGGIWEQEFVVSESNPDSVTVDLDYLIWYNTLGTTGDGSFNLYIENSPGEPTTSPVWSYLVDGTEPLQTWFNEENIDVTSSITNSGTYYIKLGIWAETGNTSGNPTFYFIGGWDNVILNWEKNTNAYPSDSPSIHPNSAFEPSLVDSWSGFSESASKDGGEIYYQISDDAGNTWYYWDGSSWSVASSSQYNTAQTINQNITDFSTSNNSFSFKAFLESDGTNLVQLDSVTIDCTMTTMRMETGSVTTDENWTSVSFTDTFSNPVIVTSYYESNNSRAASTRIRNVSTSGFEVKLQNPSGNNLNNDEITYLAIDEGVWEIDGVKIEAHKYDTDKVGSSGNWNNYDTKNFSHSYSSDPVVMHQVMSNNDSSWITTWISNISSRNDNPDPSGLNIGLNGAEATNSHGTETLGWIAIQANIQSTIESNIFETQITPETVRGHPNCYDFNYNNSYSSQPLLLGFMLQMNGGNGGWSVTCNNSQTQASFHIEEDQVNDLERNHTTERIGFIAFENDFSYTSTGGAVESSDGFKIETGTTYADENWTSVNFTENIEQPVIVTSYQESNNNLAASTRIRDVTSSGFEVKLQNPAGNNLQSDEITYLVIEEGTWEIEGVKIEAHKYETSSVSSKSNGWSDYDTKTYANSYISDPVVMHQVMTNNDSNWITTWVASISSQNSPPDTSGIRIGLNGAEVTSSHGTETLGWIAIEGNIQSLIDTNSYESYITGNTVLGHDNGCYNFNYNNSYSSSPLILGFNQSMNGVDGGWSVTCNLTTTQAGFHIEEDQVGDTDRGHTSETIAFLVFDQSFYHSDDSTSEMATSGQLISSAYNTQNTGSIQTVHWDEVIPSCSPTCTVKLQLRAAPDSGGSPGSWTNWFGSEGSTTYFTNSDGEIVPTELNGYQWIQYQVFLEGDGIETPSVQKIYINYI